MPGGSSPKLGFYVQFESENARFDQVGIGLGILHPGQPGAMYHGEDHAGGLPRALR